MTVWIRLKAKQLAQAENDTMNFEGIDNKKYVVVGIHTSNLRID